MQLGIFAKTFSRPTLEATLDAVCEHGISHVQFNMSCAGLPTLPEEVSGSLCDRIAGALATRGLTMAAISGTFNMIHPDRAQRAEGLRRLGILAAACPRMGTSLITLCTGSRDPQSMWKKHPENGSQEAWDELVASMRTAADLGAEYGVTLGIEPEVSNVIDSAAKARRLIDELGSPRFLRVIMDGANLFHEGELPRMHQVLDEAFAQVGDKIILAHAKDLNRDGEAGDVAPGQGKLDYDHYLQRLRQHGYDGPLIIHGVAESDVAASLAFLRGRL